MQAALTLSEQIHTQAVAIATRYRNCETDLVEILQQVEQHRVFLEKDCSSLFEYAVKELKLSRDTAYGLIAISRKSREVPELKEHLKNGKIHVTNARRIVPVITSSNKDLWLEKASDLSERNLEKEIATVRPQVLTPERAKYVTKTRVKLEMGLSESSMMKLRRAQDLESQARQTAATLEDVIETSIEEYLERHDPVRRAKRQIVRKGSGPAVPNPTASVKTSWAPGRAETGRAVREPVPAAIIHQVNLRDERRCRHINTTGARCNQTRFLEVHHQLPVSQGGANTVENLITLCSIHHAWVHQRKFQTDGG